MSIGHNLIAKRVILIVCISQLSTLNSKHIHFFSWIIEHRTSMRWSFPTPLPSSNIFTLHYFGPISKRNSNTISLSLCTSVCQVPIQNKTHSIHASFGSEHFHYNNDFVLYYYLIGPYSNICYIWYYLLHLYNDTSNQITSHMSNRSMWHSHYITICAVILLLIFVLFIWITYYA